MLDNTVAGGITAGDTPRASIIRECAEEASLSPQFVAPRIKQAGVVTYHYRTAAGWLQPEVQYVYDLRLPPPGSAGAEGDSEGTQPSTNPADGEVESFELLTLEKTVKRMCAGEFKPNCALCVLPFLPPWSRADSLPPTRVTASSSTSSCATDSLPPRATRASSRLRHGCASPWACPGRREWSRGDIS